MLIDRRSFLLAGAAGSAAFAQAFSPGPIGQPGRRHVGRFIWFDLATDDPAPQAHGPRAAAGG